MEAEASVATARGHTKPAVCSHRWSIACVDLLRVTMFSGKAGVSSIVAIWCESELTGVIGLQVCSPAYNVTVRKKIKRDFWAKVCPALIGEAGALRRAN
jgi:hypothetical protein